jgi:hypothetical protein
MWSRARLNAWRKGFLFEISKEWITERILAGTCEATGIPFDMTPARNVRSNFGPSIDRRDSRGGYTEENCQLVVWIYNAAKGAGSHEDVVQMARALVKAEALADARAAANQEGKAA